MAFIVHPDANRIALFHERRFRLALQDRLDRAHLGKATVAEPALGDRLARAAVRIAVRHGARSDDRSRTQIPCLRRMGDALAEVEGHVDAGIGAPPRLAVELDEKRYRQLPDAPATAERFRGHDTGGPPHHRTQAPHVGQESYNKM